MAKPNLHFASLSTTAKSTLKQLKLSEAATFLRGLSLSKDDVREVADVSNGVPCVLYGHLYTTYGEITYSSKYETDAEIDEKVTSKAGDVLMPTSDVTPRGLATATCVMFDNAIVGGDINILRPQPGIDGRYLSLAINSQKQKLYPLIVGSTVRHLHASDLKGLSYFFPSIEEQQKIAEFFTALDEKIRCLDDLAKGFSQSMQGVLNKVFTQQISFKDENGNNYSEWTIKKIKDVAPLQRGSDLPTSQLQDGECTVIYSNGQTAKHSAFKCDGCAVVTGRSGTIGKVFYLDNCKYWPHNTTLWVTDFCGNNPKFIYYLFKFVGLERFSTGTGVPTLNRNDVHDYVVKIPSIDEQTKIVEFLDCYNKKLNLLISKKHAFHELKKAFMQRMFV